MGGIVFGPSEPVFRFSWKWRSYPQSNGKIERWHKSLKGECIRPGTPLSLEDARRLVESYVEHYNDVRLNSAIGYITPKDMLAGRQHEIHAERDRRQQAA
jgi:transposase InsO family protein